MKHKRGQWYKIDSDIYVLMVTGSEMALVNPMTGYTWSGAHPVKDHNNITEIEFKAIGSSMGALKLIAENFQELDK